MERTDLETGTAQVSRYAASQKHIRTRSRANALEREQRTSATDRHREQQQQPAHAEKSSLQGNNLRAVTATDGSNLALQFSGKRYRQVHIDPITGTTTPEGEWRTCNATELFRWVQRTSIATSRSAGTFIALGDAL